MPLALSPSYFYIIYVVDVLSFRAVGYYRVLKAFGLYSANVSGCCNFWFKFRNVCYSFMYTTVYNFSMFLNLLLFSNSFYLFVKFSLYFNQWHQYWNLHDSVLSDYDSVLSDYSVVVKSKALEVIHLIMIASGMVSHRMLVFLYLILIIDCIWSYLCIMNTGWNALQSTLNICIKPVRCYFQI